MNRLQVTYLERQDRLDESWHEEVAREVVSVEHCVALCNVRETVGKTLKALVRRVVDHFLRQICIRIVIIIMNKRLTIT